MFFNEPKLTRQLSEADTVHSPSFQLNQQSNLEVLADFHNQAVNLTRQPTVENKSSDHILAIQRKQQLETKLTGIMIKLQQKLTETMDQKIPQFMHITRQAQWKLQQEMTALVRSSISELKQEVNSLLLKFNNAQEQLTFQVDMMAQQSQKIVNF